MDIVIKAPNQKYDDVRVNCQLHWTVLDLKRRLCEEYPSKPKLGDQRLIYSGHLLKDTQLLSDIIQPLDNGDVHTFHLVVPARPSPKESSTSNSENVPTASTSTPVPTATTTTAPVSSPPPSQPQPTPSPAAAAYTLPPMFPNDAMGNMAAMHDTYSTLMVQQYVQYMRYYYMSQPMPYASFEAFMQAMHTQGILPGPQMHDLDEQQPQPQLPVAAVNDPDAADLDDGAQRNWAELLTFFTKGLLLLSIMYYYTSLLRLFLLAAIVLGVTIYRYIYFVDQIAPNNQPAAAGAANAVVPPPAPPVDRPEVNNNEPEDPAAAPAPIQQPALVNNPESTRNTLRLVWIFVSSLFSSLIPDPVPIN